MMQVGFLVFCLDLTGFIFCSDDFSSNINFGLLNLPASRLLARWASRKLFYFYMFWYELFIWAGLIAHFGCPIFKFWLKACLQVCHKSKFWQLMFSFLSLSVNYMRIFKAWRCAIQHLQPILMSLHQTRTSWSSCRIPQSVSNKHINLLAMSDFTVSLVGP